MDRKKHVMYTSAEVSPYAKSGEMADVAGSLPKFLSGQGMRVSVFMPNYRTPEIESLRKELVVSRLEVPVGETVIKGRIFKTELGSFSLYLCDNPKYFWRDHVYGAGRDDYLDNDERFVFFNRALLEFLVRIKKPVDIIHCNNWTTALIPVFLKTLYKEEPLFRDTSSVLTLHNIAYQGEFPPESMALTGLSWDYFQPSLLSQEGKFNFLKSGILFSDVMNTVSSSYRERIMTNKHGFGLGELLRSRRSQLFSIRNGVDYEVWNPVTDPYIVRNYTPPDLEAKKLNKLDLFDEFGLKMGGDTPLFGMSAYLSPHKGFELLLEAVDRLMALDLGIVISGRGDEKYVKHLKAIQKRYRERFGFRLETNPALTHKVVAGADFFLIPSFHEPGGLNQLYCMKYGTVPVVRATGGLAETVQPLDSKTGTGNGIVFRDYTPEALLKAVAEAIHVYGKPQEWAKLVCRGYGRSYSWEASAKKYLKLYANALKIKELGGNFG